MHDIQVRCYATLVFENKKDGLIMRVLIRRALAVGADDWPAARAKPEADAVDLSRLGAPARQVRHIRVSRCRRGFFVVVVLKLRTQLRVL